MHDNRPARPPLVRSSDRVIAGVCAGLADHLGWPVRMVRIGMVVAALAGGAGVAFYAWLWIMVPTADESAKRNARRPASPIAPAVSGPYAAVPATSAPGAAAPAHRPGRRGAVSRPGMAEQGPEPWRTWFAGMRYGKEILLGAGLLLAAGILIARLLGLDVPLGTLIPAAAILGGAAIAWMQLDETRRAGLRGQDQGRPGRRLGPARRGPRPGGGGRAGDGVRLWILGADLAGPAGLRGRPRRAWRWCCCPGG